MNSITVAVDSVISDTTEVLHIIDFGMWSSQWGPIFRKLHLMGEIAPKLRLFFVEPPLGTPKGLGPSMRMEDLTHELTELKAKCCLNAEIKVVGSRLEDLKVESLDVRSGEFLVVNCSTRLSQLMDAQVVRWSPRDAVLRVRRYRR